MAFGLKRRRFTAPKSNENPAQVGAQEVCIPSLPKNQNIQVQGHKFYYAFGILAVQVGRRINTILCIAVVHYHLLATSRSRDRRA